MSGDEVRDGRRGVFWMHDDLYDVWAKEIGVYGVVVYGLLCRRADKRYQCYPSLKGMAKQLAISKSKLCATLDALEARQLIRRTTRRDKKGGHTSTLYTVLEPPYLVRTEDKGSPHDGQAPVRGTDTKESTTGRNTKSKPKGNMRSDVTDGREVREAQRWDGYEWLKNT